MRKKNCSFKIRGSIPNIWTTQMKTEFYMSDHRTPKPWLSYYKPTIYMSKTNYTFCLWTFCILSTYLLKIINIHTKCNLFCFSTYIFRVSQYTYGWVCFFNFCFVWILLLSVWMSVFWHKGIFLTIIFESKTQSQYLRGF